MNDITASNHKVFSEVLPKKKIPLQNISSDSRLEKENYVVKCQMQ